MAFLDPIVSQGEQGAKEVLVQGFINTHTHLIHCHNSIGPLSLEKTFILVVYRKDGSRETYLIPPHHIQNTEKRYDKLHESIPRGRESHTDYELQYWYGITRNGEIEE